jgi:hypothetical protein
LTNFFTKILLVLCLCGAASAAPLETSFFTWEVPQGWTVERNPSGLWQLTAPGPEPLEALVSVGRLSTSPELYLQGTANLWKSLGAVETLQPWITDRPNQAWFLVKHFPQPGQKPMATVKWVRWRGPVLVVTSFVAAEANLKSWAPKIRSMARDLKLLKPEFEEAVLREEIDAVLRDNEDSLAALNDVAAAKLAMNVARQDWEPFFAPDDEQGAAGPALYKAYIGYLEARFDAAFAIVNGPELGMGADVVESRLRGVAIRRDELRRQAQGF